MNDAFIRDAIRTPVGRHGGALSAVRADDLATLPLSALTIGWRHGLCCMCIGVGQGLAPIVERV